MMKSGLKILWLRYTPDDFLPDTRGPNIRFNIKAHPTPFVTGKFSLLTFIIALTWSRIPSINGNSK